MTRPDSAPSVAPAARWRAWLKPLAGVAAVAAAWTGGVGMWLPDWARPRIEAAATEALGTPVTIAAVRIQPWTLAVEVDGVPQANWSRFAVRVGQLLQLGYARSGQRAYLAVAGGFHGPTQLGSIATQQRDGLGGLHGDGRALQAGDWLRCAAAQLPGVASVPWPYLPDIRAGHIRLIQANQIDSLLRMAGSDRVDGVYLNPRVVAHQLRQMRMAADSLVFDPELPHVEDHYYLSSIHHPQLIEAFNRFLLERAELVGEIRRRHGL